MVKTRDSNDIYILIDYKTEFFYSKKQNLYLYLKKKMEMITFTTVLMGGLTPNKDGNGDCFTV